MEERIKEIVLKAGADVCGIANIERFAGAPEGFHPRDIFQGCRSVVVFGKRLPKGLAFVSPRIVYNYAGDVILRELDRISYEAAIAIEDIGGTAVPLPSDTPYDYWETETMTGRGIMSMRHAAVLAGLGSFGKNTLVINRKYGNMLSYGAVLTDLDLKSDDMSEELCIKGCRKCLDACPTKALDGSTANQSLCRPHTYGANARGFGIVNCNKCRVVCPRVFGVK